MGAGLAACAAAAATPSGAEAWPAWRETRVKDIGAPDGWAALAGLFWLREGVSTVGVGRGWDVTLPEGASAGTGRLGELERKGAVVVWKPSPGSAVEAPAGGPADGRLASDKGGKPTRLKAGTATFWVIERGSWIGVRVRDPESPGRKAFRGIDAYPYDPSWRLGGRFEPFPAVKRRLVQDVTGNETEYPSPGVIVVRREGREFRLTVLDDEDAGDLWVLFRDATSGHGTYGGGRFLHVAKPDAGGAVTVDFNYAYNPPCAFTRFATCPLPPAENRLTAPVTAGEKGGAHDEGAP